MVAVARFLNTLAAGSHPGAAALSSPAGQVLTPVLVKHVIHRCWSSPLDLRVAHHMFDQMSSAWPRPYTRFFNLLRSKTLKSGYPLAALSFHSRMVHGAGVPPDPYAFGISIHCCAQLGAPDLAFGFLSDMIKRCCEVDVVVVGGLVDGLCAEGRLADALQVFDKMPDMGCAPDVVLHSRILGWCCEFRGVELGEAVFCRILKHGDCVDTLFWTILIDGLCLAGRICDAVKMFDRMTETGSTPDEVTYRILIRCCFDVGLRDLAMAFFCRVLKEGCERNAAIFTALVDGLGDAQATLLDSLVVFSKTIGMGWWLDVITYGSLVDNLCRLGRVDLVFGFVCHMLKRGFQPNTITVTSIIDGLCKMDMISEAVALFWKMPEMGILANEFAYSSLIDCFCSLGYMEIGLGFFCHLMKHGHRIDTVILTSLIHGHCKVLRINGAGKIFGAMQEMGCAPDDVTYGALIDCCHRLGNIDVGYGLLCGMLKQGIPVRKPIWSILIHGICTANGLPDEAQLTARMSKLGCEPNVIACGILIKFWCQNRGVDQALELHKKMSKWGSFCRPNVVTYTTIVCRLAKEGRMDEASKLLEEMTHARICPSSISHRNMIRASSSLPRWQGAAQFFHKISHHEDPSATKQLIASRDPEHWNKV